ncbi:MAG TPA: signal peptidase II [Clostridia bacterium]|nr:signal peptidase II [Clostridia bacterium]HOR13018.1 signal peptidase II [Clostridia bacterium]
MLEAIIVFSIVGLDQWVKYLTDTHLMPLGATVPLWEDVFHFTSAHNTGAAFGMLSGSRWLLIAVSLLACSVLAGFLIKKGRHQHLLLRISLALILAGAAGNLIDRIALGYVRDMLDFRLINFAIFNVADSAVTIGAVLLAADVAFGKGKTLLSSNTSQPDSKAE